MKKFYFKIKYKAPVPGGFRELITERLGKDLQDAYSIVQKSHPDAIIYVVTLKEYRSVVFNDEKI